ncbi:MAG: sugar ABC transporter permease [Saccharofermentans sp.]|nr:sugar ABC transporter permease [Saccharofermentans sp.]
MGKNKSIERHYNKWGYIFIIPFVLGFLIFHLWPMLTTFYYAFCDLKHVTVIEEPPPLLIANGLPWYKNFADLFETGTFASALRNTAIFFVAQTIPEWILAFWLAAVLTDRRLKIKGRWLFKTAFFFPNLMVSPSLLSLIIFFYTARYVIYIISLVDGFGITEEDIANLLQMRVMIVLAGIFMHFGITCLYAIVGVTSVPTEVLEAAEVDGANRPYTFFRVTLPCMRPILFFIVILSVVDGLGMSEIPSYFGDPYDTQRRTITLMDYLERLLNAGKVWDRSSAFCLVMLVISAAISGLIYFTLIRDRYEAKLQRQIRKEKREERRLEKQRLLASKGQ